MQALAAVFLMNNLNYVVQTLEGSSELGGLGSDWVDINRPLVSRPTPLPAPQDVASMAIRPFCTSLSPFCSHIL